MATGEPKRATFTKFVSEAFETRNFASPVPLAGIVSEFCPVPRSGNRYDVSIRRYKMPVQQNAYLSLISPHLSDLKHMWPVESLKPRRVLRRTTRRKAVDEKAKLAVPENSRPQAPLAGRPPQAI